MPGIGFIIGWHHTPFGKHPNDTVESLLVKAGREAIQDAGLEPADIDHIVVGHFNGGMSRQAFTAPLALHISDSLRFKSVTRSESACATGSAAIFDGLRAIKAGDAKRVLVIGVEKMSDVAGADIGEVLLRASYLPEEKDTENGFAGVFARIADQYAQQCGDPYDAMAHVASKNHANGTRNPLAHFQKEFDLEFCRTPSRGNPEVAGRLRRSDCSPVSDGAAAIVLSAEPGTRKAAAFRATATCTDFLSLQKRAMPRFEGCSKVWHDALSRASLTLGDLSLVETHDCFTIAELLEYEAMGLTPEGKGAVAALEGWTRMDGRLPVNPSGGLKSRGHPIGATGVSMHIMAAMQVLGMAGEMQVPGAQLAGVFNMGGVSVSNYCSILEAAA